MRSLVLISMGAFLLACGDDGSADNTTIDETGQTTMTTSSETGSTTDQGSSSSSTSVSTSDTSSEAGSSSGSSGVESSSGVDSSSGSESGGDPDGVACFFAPAPCMAGEVCCAGNDVSVCQAPDARCDGELVVCDGTEDCSDQLCCGTDGGGTECADTCTGYHICNGDNDCNEGESCCPNGGGAPNGGLQHCMTLEMGEECPLPP